MRAWFGEAIALLSIPDAGPDGHESRMQIREVIKQARKDKAALPNADDIRRRDTTGASFEPGSTGELLLDWLDRHEKAGDKKKSTLHGYRGHVKRLLVPVLGHIAREKLNADDIWKVFEAIDKENARIVEARESADSAVRKSVAGRRLAGVKTKRRVLATLRSALGEAATSVPGRPRLLAYNAAAGIKLGKQGGMQKTARSKARLWTKAREERWRADLEKRCEGLDKPRQFLAWKNTAARPSNVMIWRPEHLGLFLDHAVDDRLYAIFCVIAYCGLRRGEAVGLKWEDYDEDAAAIMIGGTIIQLGYDAFEQDDAKTLASEDWVRFEPLMTEALADWRAEQAREREAMGGAWVDSGYIFTNADGTPLHPGHVTLRFMRLCYELGLPPIRLHDLGHGAATLALAAGRSMKEVQAMLRHSSPAITAEIYVHVLPELQAEVSAAVVSMVPRIKGRRKEPPKGGLKAVVLCGRSTSVPHGNPLHSR
jgi:integrase